jgi:MFS family permease
MDTLETAAGHRARRRRASLQHLSDEEEDKQSPFARHDDDPAAATLLIIKQQQQQQSQQQRTTTLLRQQPTCGTRLLLVATYLIYILVNTVNGPLFPAISTDLELSSGVIAGIASAQTAAQAAGKLVWGGWPVDWLGAARTYVATMLVLGVLVFSYSFASSALALGILVATVEFVSTPVYAAHVQFVRGWWGEGSGHADGFRLLGGASRCADVLSKLAYGSLVTAFAWQQVTWFAAGFAVLGAILGGAGHRDSPSSLSPCVAGGGSTATKTLSPKAAFHVLRRFVREPLFWLSAAELSLTTIVKRTCELLMPLYFSDVVLLSDGQAAQLAAAWSAGVAVSVLCGGQLFAALRTGRQRRLLVAFLLCSSSTSMAALALWPEPSSEDESSVPIAGVAGRATLVFCGGAGIGLAYYIPSGLFAVQFGGTDAGVLSCYLDAISFGVAAAFLAGLQVVIDGAWGWTGAWALLAGCCAIAAMLTPYFLWRLECQQAAFEADATGEYEPLPDAQDNSPRDAVVSTTREIVTQALPKPNPKLSPTARP